MRQKTSHARPPRPAPKTRGPERSGDVAARPIHRVLIANRGEIALRVMRACREMGLSPVIVYSEADRDSLPVRLADAAFCIGPAPARSSYLDGGAILRAAREAGADAIHPGYGFLAENARFAEACEKASITFIGPPPEAMHLAGDKVEARRLMMKRGVPVIPGLPERAADVAAIATFGRANGYPIILKAAAGGGGRGMRVVRAESELEPAVRTARSEAMASFGDDGIYAEKFLENVRHIEVQILADAHGGAVHLGERECSVQRRHQKLVEEAPSVALQSGDRERIGRAALEVVKACGYRNAGTIEFLMDARGQAYFMEVNARIQVEHPVTEMVTGIDLVRAQIGIARGDALQTGDGGQPRGWAIECRILAEDPENGFRPSPGRVAALRIPAGPGIRVDTALQAGDEISLHYDALIAKLIAWGRDRDEAIARMRRALDEFMVAGVRTTLPFDRALMADPDFVAGRLDIGYLERAMPRLSAVLREPGPQADVAAIAAAVRATEETLRPARSEPPAGPGAWAAAGRHAQMEARAPDRWATQPTGATSRRA